MFTPKIIPQNVSTLDVLPTLVELVGGTTDHRLPMDGVSLVPWLHGLSGSDEVYGEYAGEGTIAPLMMIRKGPWKFVICHEDPPQLYNLKEDPKELHNLAKSQNPETRGVLKTLDKEAYERWNFGKIHDKVLESQRKRRLCWEALRVGRFESWDYQPRDDAREKYVRNCVVSESRLLIGERQIHSI